MPHPHKLHIGMTLAPTWLSGEGWRRADSAVEHLFDGQLAVAVARRAEAACADFVFCPDVMSLQQAQLETGMGFSSLDPTLLLTMVAQHTRRIGLLTTISTTFLPPYVVARQLQSLHQLSHGRAGWNIVTALDGHANFGLESMPSASQRYARAEEFTDVVRQLWDSFPANALLLDRASGRFADAAQVAPISHQGPQLQVQGPLNVPAHASPIPLVQAGASAEGKRFAARVSDAVFASTPDREAARTLRQQLHQLAVQAGRSPADIRLMPGLSLYLGRTRDEAQALFADTHARANHLQACRRVQALLGIDVSAWPPDRPVRASDLPSPETFVPHSRTHAELLRRLITREALAVQMLLRRPEVMGSGHWQIIGTVDDAVAEIQAWHADEAIDGFVALPGGSTACMHQVLDELLPRLAETGLFRRHYAGRTFAEHLADD